MTGSDRWRLEVITRSRHRETEPLTPLTPVTPPPFANGGTRETRETRVIGERYVVQRRLGSGGMSIVDLAWDTKLQREVAIKSLRTNLVTDPDHVSQFRQEGQLLARVESRHVVRIYDMHYEPNACYLVLERLNGSTLEKTVMRQGTYDPVGVLELARDLLNGLIDLHREGLVHRDIKPSNIIIDVDGRAVLLDLGVAIEECSAPSWYVAGTPAFMSPEQRGNDRIDERSDLYQVGLVLLYALTGEHASGSVVHVPGGLPRALVALIARAVASDRTARFQSANEMYEAIELAAKDIMTCALRTSQIMSISLIGAEDQATRELAPLANAEAVVEAKLEPKAPAFAAEEKATEAPRLSVISAAAVAALLVTVGATISLTHDTSSPAPSAPAFDVQPGDDAPVRITAREPVVVPPPAQHVAAPPPVPTQATVRHARSVKNSATPIKRPVPRAAARVAPLRVEQPTAEASASSAPPTTAAEFLAAARAAERRGARETAIAAYRQALRRVSGAEATAIANRLRELERLP